MTKEVKKELDKVEKKYYSDNIDKEICWRIISAKEDLSEDFIIEFQDRVHFDAIYKRKEILLKLKLMREKELMSDKTYHLFKDEIGDFILEERV